MQITFDVSAYHSPNKVIQRRSSKKVIVLLRNLVDHGCFEPGHHRDIERLMIIPSLAFSYVRMVTREKGMSPEGERVFLANPSVALQYLRFVNRPFFADPDVQRRWHKKMVRDPAVAFRFCHWQNRRLTEKEEEIFVKDMRMMKDYSMLVIKGPFPDHIHQMLLLQSFGDRWDKDALKDYLLYAEACKRNLSEKSRPAR